MKTYTAAELETRDARRHAIAEMMLEGRWRGSATRRSLAKAWNLKVSEVYALEGEAAGSIRLARRDGWRDEAASIAEAKYAELDEIIRLARRTVRYYVVRHELEARAAPSIGAMLKAIQMQLEIVGAVKRPGDKVQPGAVGDEYDRMTPAERVEALEEALAAERASVKEVSH